ncbi:uncharacterized protein LOC106753424 isoform X2 [Vigna radiata var. radiata]|uniref:Uncharacterized protein LOC106753424 isoform X2 n=1 Tax=Vigna radiata var. radiata TaxID=3916 RepID=A0A3Q0ENN2_VIGRR|nr:uncharacterized protein LOC106753424 isoform X2 [Vigna radiata var. radiata]
MAKEGPNWDGLLKWSIANSDGTAPTRNLSEEDRKWFMEAMQAQTIDVVKRMKEITLVMQTPEEVLKEQGVTAADIEDLLEELQEHVESIDMANALIRHNKSGITAFRLANGYAALKDALTSENVRFQRKALNLIHYLLHENNSDCNIVNELGFPRMFMHLASSEDSDVREAALRSLLELAHNTKDRSVEDSEKMKQLLQERINNISLMSAEDLGVVREERQLVDSLWSSCFNEPSSLREKGLLVLPGEDNPPPDVASKYFESPLRSSTVNPSSNNDSKKEKRETPLLLGSGPSSADSNNAVSSNREADARSRTDAR